MFKKPVPSMLSSEELAIARQQFEAEKMTRRAALKKFGITSGMAIFGMFAADDLARMVIKKMEEHQETRQIAEIVAHEFKNSGIAFASSSVTCDSIGSSCKGNIKSYGTQKTKSANCDECCAAGCDQNFSSGTSAGLCTQCAQNYC